MKNVLLDTDVILDFFFDRKPYSDNSAVILNMCEKKQIIGFLTPVIISNCYYLLRKTASHHKVIDKLSHLLSITEVLNIDKPVVVNALRSEFKDFEDALQNFAATSSRKVEVIVTRNIKDFKTSKIAILTPETFLKLAKVHC